MKRVQRGYTMMEIVVVLAIFGVFIFIVVILTNDMRTWEKRMPVNYLSHPNIAAVVSRLRSDVQHATNPYYKDNYNQYSMSDSTLILYTLETQGTAQTVVWDFSKEGEVTRHAFNDVAGETSTWTAHGTPSFKITTIPTPDNFNTVEIQALDKDRKLAIDQIIHPRPH